MNIALIPARGGSKSIPKKNIKIINNHPLISWVINASIKSKYVDETFVSTDSNEIADISRSYGATIVSRSAKTATDTASTESCMLEFAEKHEFDNIILLQATSPLTKSQDIDNAFEIFKRGYDSVLSLVESTKFIWELDNYIANPINYNPQQRPRRQDMKTKYIENGAIYITSKKQLLKTKCRISGKIGSYIMDAVSYFEIDDPKDWDIIERLIK